MFVAVLLDVYVTNSAVVPEPINKVPVAGIVADDVKTTVLAPAAKVPELLIVVVDVVVVPPHCPVAQPNPGY